MNDTVDTSGAMVLREADTANLPALTAGSVQSYIDAVNRIPALSREEEEALFEQLNADDDLDAARRIIMAHLRYVVFIARSYTGYGLPLEDLIQQGNVGLMKSVRRFDLSHGVRLVSFAVHWIKAEIHEYILRNSRIVKIATTKAQRKLFFNLRKAKQHIGWFNQDEVQQLADDLDVREEDVLEMEARLAGYDESFDAPTDADEDDNYSPSAWLKSSVDDPATLVADSEMGKCHQAALKDALASLDERSLDIIQNRWLTEDKKGLKELAAKYGVSLERIRQIEVKAIERMQPFFAAA